MINSQLIGMDFDVNDDFMKIFGISVQDLTDGQKRVVSKKLPDHSICTTYQTFPLYSALYFLDHPEKHEFASFFPLDLLSNPSVVQLKINISLKNN